MDMYTYNWILTYHIIFICKGHIHKHLQILISNFTIISLAEVLPANSSGDFGNSTGSIGDQPNNQQLRGV